MEADEKGTERSIRRIRSNKTPKEEEGGGRGLWKRTRKGQNNRIRSTKEPGEYVGGERGLSGDKRDGESQRI
jgi:hypothetical protein